MRQIFLIHKMPYILILALSLFFVGCGSASVADSEATAVTFQLVIQGTSAESCTVTGAYGALLGEGVPAGLTYSADGESTVLVSCGDDEALVPVGQAEVEMSAAATQAATVLSGTALQPGSEYLAAAISEMADVESEDESDASAKTSVTASLADWVLAYDALIRPTPELEDALALNTVPTDKQWLAKFIVNWGDAALFTASGRICNATTVAAYSSSTDSQTPGATCELASALGLSSYYAVYHQLVSFTDWNDPQMRPPLDATAFDLYFKEDGALAALLEALKSNRTYTFTQVYDAVTTGLGFSFYSQDRAGTISAQTFTAAELKSYLQSLSSEVDAAVRGGGFANFGSYLRSKRFHVSYNPAGGRFFDAVYEAGPEPTEACFPSTGDATALVDCNLTLKRYDLNSDGTLSENASGDYYLQWEYDGGYTTTGFLREVTTSRYARDERYLARSYTIDSENAQPAYVYNERYDATLDPLLCGDGTTLPFSNDDWTALCTGGFSFVDNAYVLPKPEIMARVFFIVNQIADWDALTSYQAYALIKLILHGNIAYPIDTTQTPAVYALLADSDQTATEIDSALSAFFAAGTAQSSVYGQRTFAIKNGAIGLGLDSRSRLVTSATSSCWVRAGGTIRTETCTLKTKSLNITAGTGTDVDYGRTYTVTGKLEIESSNFDKEDFNVTSLWVFRSEENPEFSGLYGRFAGENGFTLYVNFASDMTSAAEGSGTISGSGGFHAFQ